MDQRSEGENREGGGELGRTGVYAFWSTLEVAGTQIATLAIFGVLARFVSPTQFGLMSIAFAIVFTIKAVLIDGLVFAVARNAFPSDEQYSTAFWLTFGLGVISGGSIFLSAELLQKLFSNADGLTQVLRSMGIMLVFMSLARVYEVRLSRLFQ